MSTTPFRNRLSRFFAHPGTDVAVAALIILSVVLTVFEASCAVGSVQELRFFVVESVITGIFIVELSLRWYCARSTRAFFSEYWIDVLSILPIVRPLRILRILRVARIVRVGIIFTRRGRRMASLIHESLIENLMVFGVLLGFLLLGAVGMLVAERGNPEFSSFSHSTWWSLFTLMAGEPVGASPTTTAGRFITAAVMIGGFTLFAMFTGVISAVMVTRLRNQWEARDMELHELRDHTIICGWNRSAVTIIQEIQRDEKTRNMPIVLVAELDEPPAFASWGCRIELLYFVRGDYTSTAVLQKAGIDRASATVLLADKSLPRTDQDRDARTLLAALTIEKLRPGIFTCAELLRRENIEHLSMAKVEEIVIGDEYMGHLIAHSSRTRGVIKIVDELLTASRGNQFYKIATPAHLVGKTFFEALLDIKKTKNSILVAVEAGRDESAPDLMTNPPSDYLLNPTDSLVLIATSDPESRNS